MQSPPPLTEAHLVKAERDAKPLLKAWGAYGAVANHVVRLAAEVRRLRDAPPPAPSLPMVSIINSHTTAMLANRNPATDRAVYLSQDPYTPTFVRNPGCWLNSVKNVSCFSPAQLSGAAWNGRAGTLVTRRHLCCAAHFSIPIIEGGTPVLFVAPDNTVVVRHAVAQVSDSTTDLCIVALDSDVPDSISIAPVLPAHYARHLGQRSAILAVALDAEERVNLLQCSTFFNGAFGVNALHERYAPPDFQALAGWSEPVVVGDSGNPTFLLIDNELTLLGCFWTAMGGPHVGDLHALANQMIDSLTPGYCLTAKIL